MVFLLVVATLLAPILALVFADWWREHKRAKREAAKQDGMGRAPKEGWVREAIKRHEEGKP